MIKEWGMMYKDELMKLWKTQKFRKLPGLE
jgi:hypothetical protein